MSERCLPVEIGSQYFLFRLSDVIAVQSRDETFTEAAANDTRIPVFDLNTLFWGGKTAQGYAITVGPCAFLVNHIRPAVEVDIAPLPALITGPFGGVVRGGLVQMLLLDCARLIEFINYLSAEKEPA